MKVFVKAIVAGLMAILMSGAMAQGNEIAVMETTMGTIVFEFLENRAPRHVKNFKGLANKGYYDGTTFHRVIPGFMIQGGDPNSKSTDRSMHGMGGPGYTIKAEFNNTPHDRGIVSMARSQDPDSAGSQFFITVKDSHFLDNQYTAFGRIIKGMKVVDKIVSVPRDSRDNPNERMEIKSVRTTYYDEDKSKLDGFLRTFRPGDSSKSLDRLTREKRLLEEEQKKLEDLRNQNEADRLARERQLIEEERERLETLRLAEENRQQPPEEQAPQSGTGSGFFVSKLGHVITNAHVVKGCNRVTVGDNANKQVAAEVINTDKSNDLALLKLSSLEVASAESKSLIQKLSIVVVPLASKGLLRSDDVKLGEKVLVAGYPFGDFFSNSIKVTTGVVSSTRGAGDDSGQFQLDAAVQPGNSGGPIYDSGGNIVGVVISQLDKLKVAKAIGSLPENVNFGIKASTVRQFLISSGLPSKRAVQTDEKSTEQLAEIAQNQALMVICLQ